MQMRFWGFPAFIVSLHTQPKNISRRISAIQAANLRQIAENRFLISEAITGVR